MTNGKEVVQMAMDMERTGQMFYETLALSCDDRAVRVLCTRLAKAEEGHYASFKHLLGTISRPDGTAALTEDRQAEVHRLVSSRILPDPEAVRKVGLGGKVKEALALAVKMEQDSIAFYEGMLSLISEGQPAVRQIIQEEQIHLRDLQAFGMC